MVSCDGRYSVENVPLYDSDDDEPTSKSLNAIIPYSNLAIAEKDNEELLRNADFDSPIFSQSMPIAAEPINFAPMEIDEVKYDTPEEDTIYFESTQQNSTKKSAMLSRIRSNHACRNYHTESSPLSKSSSRNAGGKSKIGMRKQIDVKLICERLAMAEAREEILAYEVIIIPK